MNYYIIDNIIPPNDNLIKIIKYDKLSSSLLRFNELGLLQKDINFIKNINIINNQGICYKSIFPYLIGVTGCISSGKSSVCLNYKNLSLKYGWTVKIIDCDKLAHQSYKYGTFCYNEIISNFPSEIVHI